MTEVNGYISSSMNVVTLNGLELTTCHWTYSRNNDSFLTEFIIGFQLLQIKSNNYNSYLPEKEAHSFQDPISSVCVSPYEKFCPIKILKLFSLPPTDIYIYVMVISGYIPFKLITAPSHGPCKWQPPGPPFALALVMGWYLYYQHQTCMWVA